jgi:hypothetical protein
MNNYLLELFKEENTVIIPGYGALTMINRVTNELMLMPYLKHNDGTLVKFIAAKEGIDETTAKSKIDAFVDEILSATSNGGSFELKGIGVLSKDASGDFVLSQSKVEESTNNSIEEIKSIPIEEVVEKVDVAPVVEEPIVEEVVIETPVVPIETENIVEEVQSTPVVEPVPAEVKVPEVEIPTIESVVATPKVEESVKPAEEKETTSQMVSEEAQWNDDLDVLPLNYKPERPKQPILEKAKKDGMAPHKKKTLVFAILALLIVGGAAFLGFNKDILNKIPFLANKTEVVEQTPTVEEQVEQEEQTEEVVQETTQEAEDVPSEEPTSVTNPVEQAPVVEQKTPAIKQPKTPSIATAGNLQFNESLPVQVIVGSFGVESNATRLAEKLKSMGFPSGVINQGGMFMVTAASFQSMEEYQANLGQLKSLGNYWVKK